MLARNPRTQGRAAGTCRSPESHRQQDGSARRAHAQGACPIRRRGRQSSHPRAAWPHAGGIAAAYGLAPARLGQVPSSSSACPSWNRGDTGGIYIEMLVCSLLYCLRAPVVLSALGGSCTVECTQVSLSQLCFSGHAITEFFFCFGFQAMI